MQEICRRWGIVWVVCMFFAALSAATHSLNLNSIVDLLFRFVTSLEFEIISTLLRFKSSIKAKLINRINDAYKIFFLDILVRRSARTGIMWTSSDINMMNVVEIRPKSSEFDSSGNQLGQFCCGTGSNLELPRLIVGFFHIQNYVKHS